MGSVARLQLLVHFGSERGIGGLMFPRVDTKCPQRGGWDSIVWRDQPTPPRPGHGTEQGVDDVYGSQYPGVA
jgi:hypothetical protein